MPIEIAKIYHSLIEDPGMSETIKRLTRDDVFVIGYDPYKIYGDFDFQL